MRVTAIRPMAIQTATAVALFLICRCLGSFLAVKLHTPLANLLSYAVITSIAALLVLFYKKPSVPGMKNFSDSSKAFEKYNRRKAIPSAPKKRACVVAASAALLAFDSVASVLVQVFTKNSTLVVPSAADAFTAVIVYPAAEEIFFRGALLSILLPQAGFRRGCVYAVIIQAVLFGVIHTPDAIPTATFAGLLFGAVTLCQPSEAYPDIISNKRFIIPYKAIAAHAVYNGAICIARTVSVHFSSPSAGIGAEFAVAAALGMAAAIMHRQENRKRIHSER